MSNEAQEISEAIKSMPVAWLHMPGLATTLVALPVGTKDAPQAKIGPFAAAAIGVAVGAGIQIGAQQLRKAGVQDASKGLGLSCTLTFKEIEQNATRILEESNRGDDGGVLQEIAQPPAGAKALPVVAAAFLAGVATGAAAARP